MTDKAEGGLFRKPQKGVGRKAPELRTWFLRRGVPKDLVGRPAFGTKRELIASMGTHDIRIARPRRDALWQEWSDLFQAEREMMRWKANGVAGPATREALIDAIEAWRREGCLAAATERPIQPPPLPLDLPVASAALRATMKASRSGESGIDLSRPAARPPTISQDIEIAAEQFFEANPAASRAVEIAPTTALLIGRLQRAARLAEGWTEVSGFDVKLEAVATSRGLTVTPGVLAQARQAFAAAWLDVEQHHEAARRRAARFLEAWNSRRIDPQAVVVGRAAGYIPAEGDKTVADLVGAYQVERERRFGAESTARKYKHLFVALQAVLGADTPIRGLSRAQMREVRDLFYSMPVHATKRYPGLSLLDACERAAEDDAELLAPSTVSTYLSNLVAMMNWAVSEDWIDKNPAAGIVDPALAKVRRRGFTGPELSLIFAAIAPERAVVPWRFWVPAIALVTGARLGEICQLHSADIGDEEGVPYFNISEYGADGRRDAEKRLKTGASERRVPIHPQLLDLGFLDWARSQNTARLFPDLKYGDDGRGRTVTRWFASLCDRLDLTSPELTFHSFRHGFRDACDAAEVPEALTHTLGGWAVKGVGNKYGRRDVVAVLARHVARIEFDGFRLDGGLVHPAGGES